MSLGSSLSLQVGKGVDVGIGTILAHVSKWSEAVSITAVSLSTAGGAGGEWTVLNQEGQWSAGHALHGNVRNSYANRRSVLYGNMQKILTSSVIQTKKAILFDHKARTI